MPCGELRLWGQAQTQQGERGRSHGARPRELMQKTRWMFCLVLCMVVGGVCIDAEHAVWCSGVLHTV